MIVAISTGFNRSFDSSITIIQVDEPITFLTPISFVRFAAVNDASPNKPRQAMKIASPANTVRMDCCWISFLYKRSNFSSRNVYSNGYQGAAFAYSFLIASNDAVIFPGLILTMIRRLSLLVEITSGSIVFFRDR